MVAGFLFFKMYMKSSSKRYKLRYKLADNRELVHEKRIFEKKS